MERYLDNIEIEKLKLKIESQKENYNGRKAKLIGYLLKESQKKSFIFGGFKTDLNELRKLGDRNYKLSLLISEFAYNLQKDNDTALNFMRILINSAQFKKANQIFLFHKLHNQLNNYYKVKFDLIKASLINESEGYEASYYFLIEKINNNNDNIEYRKQLAKYHYLNKKYDKITDGFLDLSNVPEIAYYIASIYYRQGKTQESFKILNPFKNSSNKSKRLLEDIKKNLPNQGDVLNTIPSRIEKLEYKLYEFENISKIKRNIIVFVIITVIFIAITYVNHKHKFLESNIFYIVLSLSILITIITTIWTKSWNKKFIYYIFKRKKLKEIIKSEFNKST